MSNSIKLIALLALAGLVGCGSTSPPSGENMNGQENMMAGENEMGDKNMMSGEKQMGGEKMMAQ